MAIDLEKVKSKLKDLETKNDRSTHIWKPEPGKQVIRIVPYKYNKDFPFIELYFNYTVGKRSTLSPITYGRPDPIAEFARKLKGSGNSDDYNLGRKIEPKERYFAPIIIRGSEDEGVKFWGFGKTIYAELLSIIDDSDYGDITDLENGRDVTVEFKPAESDKEYPSTVIRIKPNKSKVSDNDSILEILQNQKKIEEIYPEPTYEELKQLLEEYLNPESNEKGDSIKEEEETTVPTPPKKKEFKVEEPTNVQTAKSAQDLNAKFAKLFEEKK